MENFKIQIVEDELLVARDLAERLKFHGYEVVHISDNMDDAVAGFKKYMPDLVLLDITISGNKTGIDIAHAISGIQPTPFIYITAHADSVTVNKAKNTFPAAYVIKPFTTNSILVSIELALHNFAYQNDNEVEPTMQDGNLYLKQNHLYIKDGYRFIKLLLNDILYLSAEDNYIKVITETKEYLIRNTLTKTIEILQKRFFVRIHRSYCINTNHIESFTENGVVVNGTDIPIGRNYKKELMNIFKFR